MAMVKISPNFQTSQERNLVAVAIGLTLICGGYLSFLPPLILYFGFPDKLSDSGKHILRQFINFMADVAIIMLVLTVTILGVPFAIVVGTLAAIFVIIILLNVLNNSEVSIPVLFEVLKDSSVIGKTETEKSEPENTTSENSEAENKQE